VLTALVATVGATGCAVNQRPGHGRVLHLQEPQTGGGYYLYLPQGYDEEAAAGRCFPLVMTLQGMWPFDTAHSQIREWQQEADRYGYVVCAPELVTPYWLSRVPLDRVTDSLRRDEARILAIMDELPRMTSIDPNRVLCTAFSYGGYLAHYIVNQHPERFSCLAVKQSNFCEKILDPQATPRYRDRKVGIFFTENDLKVCREESSAAARWYSRHGFDLTFAVFQGLGHERRPSLAASFFARTCGATPKTPPVELARMQVKELPPPPLAMGSPRLPPVPAGSAGRPVELVAEAPQLYPGPTEGRPIGTRPSSTYPPADGEPVVRRAIKRTASLRTRPVHPAAERRRPAPERVPTPIRGAEEHNPITVRLSSTIGISPLLVSYSVSVPAELREGAFYLWTDNGEPISNSPNGQRRLTRPGTHRLEVLVTATDGREFSAAQIVTVLERMHSKASK
jgi:predicted esterase